MISKELLSEVLIDKCIHYVEVKNNIIWFHSPPQSMMHKWDDMCINIYELAHKCKEWALKQDHTIGSNITVCDTSVSYITDNDGEEIIFESNTEPEAIFKACEWILNDGR